MVLRNVRVGVLHPSVLLCHCMRLLPRSDVTSDGAACPARGFSRGAGVRGRLQAALLVIRGIVIMSEGEFGGRLGGKPVSRPEECRPCSCRARTARLGSRPFLSHPGGASSPGLPAALLPTRPSCASACASASASAVPEAPHCISSWLPPPESPGR